MDDKIQLQYQQEAERITAAYSAFRQVYSQSTPPPVRVQRREGVITLLKGMLILMLVGAVIVSGSHTIHVFAGQGENFLVGYSAFFMAELGLIGFSIFNSYYQYRIERQEPKSTKTWVKAGLVVIVLTAVSANILDVLGGVGGWLQTAILLVVALSAPLLVFITGEVITILFVIEGKLSQQADEQYRRAESEWQDGLTASWNANKAKWGARVQIDSPVRSLNGATEQTGQEIHSIHSLNELNGQSERAVQAANGYSKQMNARDVIEAYFNNHPERLNDRLDELGPAIQAETGVKVGRTSIHNVRKEKTGANS